MISSEPKCRLLKLSSIYETAPFGDKNQDNFYNGAAEIETDFDLFDFLAFLKDTEKIIGRRPGQKNGPREIDLDILFYNNLVYSDDKITIPHKGIIYRDFVLVPLCEIASSFIHPVINKKICEIEMLDEEKYILQKFSENLISLEEFRA
jgi:2-amino-4-hydroxy-6-hydroxymethyldihydropteridine diphosphokinase